ncbi:hypothetical protein [Aeromonas enteropelogenes]|uniref:hypothetical protein n=1 Tax=Aeromonas enteropelogenes TaxID=29489 RepID=UPI003BA3CF44
MSEQAVLVGGWTAYHKLTAEDQAVFDQALKGFVGVQYVPFEVSTQVVAGTNYRFKWPCCSNRGTNCHLGDLIL